MRLYLVQHGEAKREEEDPSRPLSGKGLKDVRKMADCASKRLGVKVARIFHSGKLRAKQTAEELARKLEPDGGVEEVDGLGPLADPKIWAEKLKGMDEDVMLVGHLPHLSKLSSLLLFGDETKEAIRFEMAGVVCLERDERGRWAVRWMVTPEIAPET